MSPLAAIAAVVFTAINLFAAGLALQSTLADSLAESAGIAAERVAAAAPARR